MKVNLLIGLYVDKHRSRQHELEYCLRQNLKNSSIDKVVAVFDKQSDMNYYRALLPEGQISYVLVDNRPTFGSFFKLINYRYPDDINIIANSDIYFDQTLQLVKDYDF